MNDGDAFIAKFSPNWTLLWSTFFGGSNYDTGRSIAVASDGSCYLVGRTESADLPMLNAFNDTYNGDLFGDGYVAKFSSSGSLLWSTYLGGNDYDMIYDVVVTPEDGCYVVGNTQSKNFPILDAYIDTYCGGYYDTFISKFSSNGALISSTFFGGNSYDDIQGIAVLENGDFYLIGCTSSEDFPILNAYNNSLNGEADIFITKFSSTMELLWSTFFGGSDIEYGLGLAVAEDGSCYVTGRTKSNDFPTRNAYDSTFGGGNTDAYVSKFSSAGELLWSTFLGGSFVEEGSAIAVASDGSCYVAGDTQSSNFPLLEAYDSLFAGINEGFISKFSASGKLLFSTYLGGTNGEGIYCIVIDADDSCYVGGVTGSNDFPTVNAFDSTSNGVEDGFIFKFKDNITKQFPSYNLLAFVFVMPIIVIICRKKRRA